MPEHDPERFTVRLSADTGEFTREMARLAGGRRLVRRQVEMTVRAEAVRAGIAEGDLEEHVAAVAGRVVRAAGARPPGDPQSPRR